MSNFIVSLGISLVVALTGLAILSITSLLRVFRNRSVITMAQEEDPKIWAATKAAFAQTSGRRYEDITTGTFTTLKLGAHDPAVVDRKE